MSASTAPPPDPHVNHTSDIQTLKAHNGTEYKLLPHDSGIEINGWRIERFKGSISNSVELDEFQSRSSIHCPEMSFLSNHLTLRHLESGLEIQFEAKEALKACSHKATAQKPEEKHQPATTTASTTTAPTSASSSTPVTNRVHSVHPSKFGSMPPVTTIAAPISIRGNAPTASSSSSSPAPSSAVGTTRPSPTFNQTTAAPPTRLQVAAASKWTAKDYDGVVVKQVDLGFDWTYTTKYKGLVQLKKDDDANSSSSSHLLEPSDVAIPISMLQRPDPILWYDTLPLFEDELHDNGIASLTVRVRVMESCIFVLMQFWLRVDDVLMRVYDTRLFHAFGENGLIREQTCRESSFDQLAKLGMPRTASLYVDPNIVSRKLALQSTEREKIHIPASQPTTQQADQAK